MNISVGFKIGSGFALALGVLLLLGVVSYQTTTQLNQSNGWVKHTYEVLLTLEKVLSLLQDSETGQRGYLITGERRYLEPYEAAQGKIPGEIAHLKELTADNSGQQARIQNLVNQVQIKLDFIKEVIEVRNAKGFEPSQKLVATDRGKQAMDTIRKIIAEMEEEETRLMKERTERAE